MKSEEKTLLDTLRKVDAYRPIFQEYAGYEYRVLPGTVTALGEVDTKEFPSLYGRNVLMVGVEESIFSELWRGFKESAAFNLLTPLETENYDLWVIAVPMHGLRRLTWIIFPVTREDEDEIAKEPKFSIFLVPVERQDFEELVARVEDALERLAEGGAFPSDYGIVLLLDLTEVFRER